MAALSLGAELTESTEAPLCDCHGESMLWAKDSRKKAGGYWRCAVKQREAHRRYKQSEKGREKRREQDHRYKRSDRGRETERASRKRLALTPGTYVYKRNHGIGLPGLAKRIWNNRRYRARATAKDLETIARLQEELIRLG